MRLLRLRLLLVAGNESRLDRLHLGLKQAERVRIGDVEAGANIDRELFVWLAELVAAMSIGTVLAEMALLLLLEVLAHLRLVVVVRDVQHLILHFYR